MPSPMATDRETRRRLRSIELRSEDLVLVRLVLAVTLRVIGALLCVLAVANMVAITGYALQPGWGAPSMLEILAIFSGPVIKLAAGLGAIIMAGTLVRHLVPARVPRPKCPACCSRAATSRQPYASPGSPSGSTASAVSCCSA